MRAQELAPGERLRRPDGRPDGRRGEFARYQRVAPLYDLLDLPFEYGRYRALRRRTFEGLSGAILDAGIGTGRNMPFYPAGAPGDATVVGIDPSPAILARAARRRDRLGAAVELLEMDVLRTSFPDQAFDAVVASFLFCVLEPERQAPALGELGRICEPGGQIRILEYAYSQGPLRRLIMRRWAPWCAGSTAPPSTATPSATCPRPGWKLSRPGSFTRTSSS